MKVQKFIPLLVVAAGLMAYHNSFTGGFVSDDVPSILQNPTIRHLWPIWQPLSPPCRDWLSVEGRPLINLSLAISYALSGYNVWGYHALNLTVHILAGLTLLGIVRRTLLQPALRERFGAAANELAVITAVLWTVHPLQTESVTYMIQRAESIMGLFYLLTLYCFIRGVGSLRSPLWHSLSVTACALGMASKEVMVFAPLMVLLYDRAFVSGSFREACRRRWPLYLGLSTTWILQGVVMVSADVFTNASMRLQHAGITWWEYLRTQPGVILYYLRLSAWPSPLCLDHGWPIATTWVSILPSALVISLLLGATIWAWRTNPAWGFVGAWFFLILAPSSSFVPTLDIIHEHRMYLPLAAVISLVVMGLYSLAGRRSFAVFMAVAIVFGFLTWRRNQDYQSELAIRVDAAAKFPNDSGVHFNLGNALARLGRMTEAVEQYEQAVRIRPNFADAQNNLGMVLEQAGRVPEAIIQFKQTLQTRPDYAEAHNNLGMALDQVGRVPEAIIQFEQALQIRPDYFEAHNNLGMAFAQTGRMPEAIGQFEQAVQIKPSLAEAHNNLGLALEQMGKLREAIGHYEQALRIEPDYAEAHDNLGMAFTRLGRMTEAVEQYEQAVRIKPNFAEAHINLGNALEQTGKPRESIRHYEQAIRIKPDDSGVKNKLARLLATLAPTEGGDPVRAVVFAEWACELTNNRVAAYLDTLAAAYAATGRFNDAITTARQAVELARSAGQTPLASEIESRLELYRAGHAYHPPASVTSPHAP